MHGRRPPAARCGTAAFGCVLLLTLATACRTEAPVYREPAPSRLERYCAWFGDEADGVLYFGQAAFWSAARGAGGNATADLRHPGPVRIGRFDLSTRRLLPAFEVRDAEARSGVWDVLPLGDRLYFTTYFETAGWVDLRTGRATRAPRGRLWNELSPGPDGSVLVSRYADADAGGGAVLVVSADLEILEEHALEAGPGEALAAKSPAWDPVRDEFWVTTDRLPLDADGFPHPTVVLSREGVPVAHFGTPEAPEEVHFVRFDERGRGHLALVTGSRLELVALEPDSDRRDLAAAARVLLDDRFAASLDFAQDIHVGPEGDAFVTRWSGRVHRVSPDGTVRSWQLPQRAGDLYYTAVPSEGGVCATRCGDVDVVCRDRPVDPPERR